MMASSAEIADADTDVEDTIADHAVDGSTVAGIPSADDAVDGSTVVGISSTKEPLLDTLRSRTAYP